ncbi:oligosaccharide flippase family protein [Candidatus Pacearchaeota archaeon]|nr:oligosaccharide flippase family protein [Candidatus Pacearchaeota archaeon]
MVKNASNLKGTIFANSLWNVMASLIGRAGALVFTIIIARALLPETFGIYSLALSIAVFCLTFTDLGINQALIIYVSTYLKNNKSKARSYFIALMRYKLIMTLSVAGIIILASYPLSFFIFNKPDLFVPLLFIGGYIVITSIEGFLESLFYAFNKVSYMTSKEIIFQATRLILSILVLTLVATSSYVAGLVGALILTMVAVIVYVVLSLRKIGKFIFERGESLDIDKVGLLKFIGYISVGITAAALFASIDIIMLGIFVPSEYIGFYKAAFTLVSSIIGILTFYNIFLPVFSKLGNEKTEEMFNTIFKYLSIIGLPAVFGLLSIGPYVLKAVYGDSYIPATPILYILAPLIFIELLAALVSSVFSAKKKPEYLAKIMLFSLVLNVLLNLSLITLLLKNSAILATIGVGAATVISKLVYLIVLFFLLIKVMKVRAKLGVVIKPLAASIIMSICLILINKSISDMNWFWGGLEIIAGIIVYGIIIILIGAINKSEIKMFYSFFRALVPARPPETPLHS